MWTPFAQRRRNAAPHLREQVWTAATGITVLRALACSALVVLGAASRHATPVLGALGLNMVLDSLDGAVARRYRHETVFGAQADGAVDRFLAMAVVLAIAALRGRALATVEALAVCCQFVMVDQILCTQFLRFGLWSPDHFYVVDETVWRLNWSPLAKLLGNVPLLLFAISGSTAWIAVPVSAALVAARAYSYALIQSKARTSLPELCHAVGPDAPDRVEASSENAGLRASPVADRGLRRRSVWRRPRVEADARGVA